MGNDWTRLVQEASKHNGPDGLRAFYASKGRWQGLAAGVLAVGSIVLAVKAKESFAKAKAADVDATPDAPEPGGQKAPKRPAAADDSTNLSQDETPDEGAPRADPQTE